MAKVIADDAWDDELLIQEYNRSVRLVDQRIEAMESIKEPGSLNSSEPLKVEETKKDKRSNKNKSDCKELLWKPGDHCVAIFKDDGIEYEAKIVSVDHKYGCCVVKYIGYENEELQYLQDLKPTRGVSAQLAQLRLFLPSDSTVADLVENDQGEGGEEDQAEEENLVKPDPHTLTTSVPEFIMPEVTPQPTPEVKPEFVLPPPPTFLAKSLSDPLAKENDALASMLMSWYMCGYQSGYYVALKQMKVKH